MEPDVEFLAAAHDLATPERHAVIVQAQRILTSCIEHELASNTIHTRSYERTKVTVIVVWVGPRRLLERSSTASQFYFSASDENLSRFRRLRFG